MNSFPYAGAVHGLYDMEHVTAAAEAGDSVSSIAAKLGLKMPNLAPDLAEFEVPEDVESVAHPVVHVDSGAAGAGAGLLEPSKKKYAKEAWPGKKPVHSFLV